MLYEEARVYLDGVSKYGSVLGLDSIKSLLNELGNPQKDLNFIHIAGTNGKGSILAYISSVLSAAGYRTGRYISPTVMHYLERFQIDGRYIGDDEFAELTGIVKEAAKRLEEKGMQSPTAFEIETAIAFLYFQKNNCDYVVLEAGLGGSLDATNIIENTRLCVFASISMDHIGVLGNTLEEIAADKAGIIKKGAVVVSAEQKPEALAVLEERARKMGCTFSAVDMSEVRLIRRDLVGQRFAYREFGEVDIPLAGQNQVENAATALAAVRALRVLGAGISDEAVREGLRETRWPGRFTVIRGNQTHPMVIVDGAHNEDAAKRLAQNLDIYLHGKKVTAVMGVFADKEYEKMINIMAPYLKKVYTVDLPNRERTLPKEALCEALKKAGVHAEAADSIEGALVLARKDEAYAGKDEALDKGMQRFIKEQEREEGAVLVFGSLSYLGEVLRICGAASERS